MEAKRQLFAMHNYANITKRVIILGIAVLAPDVVA